LAEYATMQVPILHFHFDSTFIHGVSGEKVWSVSSFGPKPKIIKINKSLFWNKKF